MIRDIAFFLILGKPLIFYLGIVTFLSFLFTASIAFFNKRGVRYVPFKWHPRMAFISLTLALLHGILGISLYFRF
jgi:hypothetical protein